MEAILSSRLRLRYFLATVVLSAALVFVLRWYVLPAFDSSTKPTIGQIAATVLDLIFAILVASLVISLVVRWLSPPESEPRILDVLAPVDIHDALHSAVTNTKEWWYRGHAGRHFRTVTLPRLAEDARRGNYGVDVYLQILDPGDLLVCAYFATYRSGLRSAAGDDPWTEARVRNELLATLLLTYAYAAEEPLLDIRVAVSSWMSVYRTDLSTTRVIVTKEDPIEPALTCPSDSFFYRSFREDARLSFDQGRGLPDIQGPKRKEFTLDTIKALFSALGFSVPEDADIEAIKTLALTEKNPYG